MTLHAMKSGLFAGLHVHIVGTSHAAVPLVLLPGLLGDSQNLRRLARDLSASRPVVLIDSLGSGKSDVPEVAADYLFSAQTDRLLAALDQAEVAQADLLGLSMGGMWAQHVLLRAKERFRCAVLAATSASTEPRLRCILQAVEAQVREGASPLTLARCLIAFLFSPNFLDRPGAVPLLEAMMIDAPPNRQGLLGQLHALSNHDLTKRLHAARNVSRIIVGEMDWLTTPQVHDRLLVALGQGDKHVLPGVGHCLWVEQPADFSRCVLEGLPA